MKDSNVYIRKDNGRYEAIGLLCDRDWLGDGIWHVKHDDGHTSIRNITHYGGIYKVGDAKYPDFSKLAGTLELADKVATSDAVHNMLKDKHTLYDECATIIGEAVRLSDDIEMKSKSRPLVSLTEGNLLKDGFRRVDDKFEKNVDGTWYKLVIMPKAYENPRYSRVEVFSTWDNEKRAEFKAEFLHQVYSFIKLF